MRDGLESVRSPAAPPSAGGRPGHAQRLPSLVGGLLCRGHQFGPRSNWIAVGVEPGTFYNPAHRHRQRTGALATAAGLPLVGVSTLQSAGAAPRTTASRPRRPFAVIDARRSRSLRGRLGCPCRSTWTPDPALAPQVLTPEQLPLAGLRSLRRHRNCRRRRLRSSREGLLAGAGVAHCRMRSRRCIGSQRAPPPARRAQDAIGRRRIEPGISAAAGRYEVAKA